MQRHALVFSMVSSQRVASLPRLTSFEFIRAFARRTKHQPQRQDAPDSIKMNLRKTIAALGISALAAVAAQNVSAPAGANGTAEQAVATATVAAASPTEQGTCGPRIRKSWDRFTPDEKIIYIRAIERAMDEGLYIKFVEIHTEQMTTSEAHRTCMFLYWHRLLLLGFENMLRSFGGEFSCLTLPYWDYVSHNSRFMAGQCGSVEDCSPILQELGGSTAGRRRSVVVNGTPVSGTCVGVNPVNHFCEASHLSGPECVGCVPRGAWTQATFPATTTVSSLMRQLFSSPTIDSVATNLEQGIHNTIHSTLGGVMGVLEAPADPIFFSHHATIDLLHSIFYHCAVGNTQALPIESKLADPRQFRSCRRRQPLTQPSIDRNVLLPESDVTLRSGEDGFAPLSVRDPLNPLFPYFAPLATEYLSYSDIRDMGDFSYNYEMSGQLASMFTTCADITSLLGGGAPFGGNAGGFGGFPGGGFRRLEDQASSGFVEAVIIPQDKSHEATDNDAWYAAALRVALNATTPVAAKNPSVSATALALREVEKMTCMFYDECRGKVADLSASFRSSFHTNSTTPCFSVVSSIKAGRDTMLVANWKDVMLKFFSC